MKKCLLILIITIILLPLDHVFAARTGKVYDDSVFVDKRLGYQITSSEGWDIKPQRDKKKKPNYQRVVLVKKNFKIDPIVRELHGEFTIPTITVFADSNGMSIDEYTGHILDQLYQVTSKDQILLNTELLSDTDMIDSFTAELGEVTSKRLQFIHRYKRFLDTTGRDINWQRNGGVKLIQNFNIIDICIFKRGDWVIMLYAVCERQFYQLNRAAVVNVFNSMRYNTELVKE